MKSRARVSSIVAALALALAAGGIGCKTAGSAAPAGARSPGAVVAPAGPPPLPPIALRPAESAKVTVSLTIAPPAQIAADLDALGRRLGIPMALGQSLIDAFVEKGGIAGIPIPRDVLAWLDPRRPLVGFGQADAEAVAGRLFMAVPFKDEATARRALETIGRETGRQDGESIRRLPDGTPLWAGIAGATLFLSNVQGQIAEAGALALATMQRPAAAQVVLSMYPGVIGPRGSELGDLLKTDDKANPMTPVGKQLLAAMVKVLGEPISQSQALRLAADVNVQVGISARFEMEPVAGSAFARRLQVPSPYAVDPTLPLSDDGTMVMAWGTSQTMFSAISSAALSTGRVGKELARASDRLSDALTGPGSCASDFTSMPVKGGCRIDVKPGIRGSEVLDRYAKFMTTLYRWADEVTGERTGKLKVRRRGDVLEIDEPILPNKNPSARALAMFASGGEHHRQALTVRDNRLLIAQGPDARARLADFGKNAPAPATATAPIRAATLSRTAGADGIGLFDFVSMVVRVAQQSNDPTTNQLKLMFAAVPGLAALHAPLVVVVRSGPKLTIELQAPYGSLENTANVARPFMGVMGAQAK